MIIQQYQTWRVLVLKNYSENSKNIWKSTVFMQANVSFWCDNLAWILINWFYLN